MHQNKKIVCYANIGVDPNIRRHSGIWGAADEAVFSTVRKIKNPPKNNFLKSKYRYRAKSPDIYPCHIQRHIIYK